MNAEERARRERVEKSIRKAEFRGSCLTWQELSDLIADRRALLDAIDASEARGDELRFDRDRISMESASELRRIRTAYDDLVGEKERLRTSVAQAEAHLEAAVRDEREACITEMWRMCALIGARPESSIHSAFNNAEAATSARASETEGR